MRAIIISLFLAVNAINISAQQNLAKVELTNGTIDHLQAHPLGDSVFFSYLTQQFKGDFIKASWICSDGSNQNFDFNEIKGKALLEISRRSNDHFFYLQNYSRKKLIEILKWDPATGSKTFVDKKIDLSGVLLTTFNDNGIITFISFNNESNELNFLKVNGPDIVGQSSFPILEFYSTFLKKSAFVESFTKGIQNNSLPGAARSKIIYDGTSFIFIIDQPFDIEFPNRVCRSTVIKVNKDSFKAEQFSINDYSKEQFSSFAQDSSFYRVCISNRKIRLSTFDLNTRKEMKSISFVVDSTDDFKNYIRKGSTHTVSKEGNFYKTVKRKMMATPAIIVSKNNKTNIIRIGTFFNEGGMMGPAGTNPAVALSVMIAGTAIRQIVEKPGVSIYFYLKEAEASSNFAFSTDDLNQKIDDFEIGFKEDDEVKSKMYVPIKNGIMGLYYFKGEKSVAAIKYSLEHDK